MIFGAGLRKLALTAHVTSSVGWLGAVAAFLALAIAGICGEDAQRVRAAYLAMDAIAWWAIIPLCFASLLTGIVQALGTSWGLFRHYWVLIKLIITLLATIILLAHMNPIGAMARAAAESALAPGELRALRIQLVLDSTAAIVALLVNTALSIYKPRGLTRYGRRKQRAMSEAR